MAKVMHMSKKRVGVLMGGLSAESEVSLRTGAGVAEALEERGHDVVRIVFGPDTRGVDELIREAEIDVAFLALHGRGGEDGLHPGPSGAARHPVHRVERPGVGARDGQAQVQGAVPPAQRPDARRTTSPTRESLDDLAEVHGSFGFPVIVKPRGEGSSVGVSRADNLVELEAAIRGALVHDDLVLIERFVRGMEVHVASSTGGQSAP